MKKKLSVLFYSVLLFSKDDILLLFYDKNTQTISMTALFNLVGRFGPIKLV